MGSDKLEDTKVVKENILSRLIVGMKPENGLVLLSRKVQVNVHNIKLNP